MMRQTLDTLKLDLSDDEEEEEKKPAESISAPNAQTEN